MRSSTMRTSRDLTERAKSDKVINEKATEMLVEVLIGSTLLFGTGMLAGYLMGSMHQQPCIVERTNQPQEAPRNPVTPGRPTTPHAFVQPAP
jgi:hypothetical protein